MPVAVVAGGTAGLGRAIVRELADDGWDVAVLARGQGRLDATVAEVGQRGRRAIGLPVDVADSAEVDAAAGRIERELGPIDLWVNGPTAIVHGEFLDIEPHDFDRTTAVTYLGFVNGTRAALSRMVPRRRGHVIQVTSALAHRGMPLLSAYSAAKGATRIFSEAVRAELLHARSPVQLSQVDMPALNTPLYDWMKSRLPQRSRPIPMVFEPEVGARAVAAVARHPRPRTWVGEPSVIAILGNRLLGGALDRVLARAGYRLQLDAEATTPMLAPNLDASVSADVAARGSFGGRSFRGSPQVWAVLHRRAAAMSVAAAVAGVGAVALRRRAREARRVRWVLLARRARWAR